MCAVSQNCDAMTYLIARAIVETSKDRIISALAYPVLPRADIGRRK